MVQFYLQQYKLQFYHTNNIQVVQIGLGGITILISLN